MFLVCLHNCTQVCTETNTFALSALLITESNNELRSRLTEAKQEKEKLEGKHLSV